MDKLYNFSSIKEVISRDIKEDMISHAYMLISSDSEYVKLLAKQMAKQILCVDKTPCESCNQCIKVEKNEHADVVILPNGKKNLVVEDVENIVSESYVLPLEGDKKIYILNDFDLTTVQAQNKLLKTLEEPPKSVVFIITTTNENNVLATIRSRCKKVFVPLIKENVLLEYLSKDYPNNEGLGRIVKISDGNLTIAKRFLDNDKMLKIKDICCDIVNMFDKSDKVLYYSSIIMEYSDELEDFLNVLLDTFKEVMVAVVNKDNSTYLINKYSPASIMEISKVIQNAVMKLKANCNTNGILDYLLLGILEVRFKCQR